MSFVVENANVNNIDRIKVVAIGSRGEIDIGKARAYLADADTPLLCCGSKLITSRCTIKTDVLRGTSGNDAIHS